MSRKRSDEPFVMIRRIMLESPAWRVLSITARRALNAIEREHLRHAGKDNGKLIVTYKNLAEYCLAGDQHLISRALRELEAMGFIIVKRGKGGNAGRYEPNEFALTYLPCHNGEPPTDQWSQITTIEEAKQRVDDAKRKHDRTEWFKTATVVGFPRKRNRKAGIRKTNNMSDLNNASIAEIQIEQSSAEKSAPEKRIRRDGKSHPRDIG